MRLLLLTVLSLIGVIETTLAHRLDECLQATRVTVSTNHIALAIDVTPGVAVVNQFLPALDRNNDGSVSTKESDAFAKEMFRHLQVRMDDVKVDLRLQDIVVPPLSEMKRGSGVIRIRTQTDSSPMATGRHQLQLTNGFLPHISVYLVNAVAPTSEAIRIVKQTRDEAQTSYGLEFEVRSRKPDSDAIEDTGGLQR